MCARHPEDASPKWRRSVMAVQNVAPPKQKCPDSMGHSYKVSADNLVHVKFSSEAYPVFFLWDDASTFTNMSTAISAIRVIALLDSFMGISATGCWLSWRSKSWIDKVCFPSCLFHHSHNGSGPIHIAGSCANVVLARVHCNTQVDTKSPSPLHLRLRLVRHMIEDFLAKFDSLGVRPVPM